MPGLPLLRSHIDSQHCWKYVAAVIHRGQPTMQESRYGRFTGRMMVSFPSLEPAKWPHAFDLLGSQHDFGPNTVDDLRSIDVGDDMMGRVDGLSGGELRLTGCSQLHR